MLTTTGKVFYHKGAVFVKTTRPPVENLSDDATIVWHDKRKISPEQRRKAWALVGEIAAAYGYIAQGDKDLVNQNLKGEFLRSRIDKLQAEAIRAFSLSDVDMTMARMYIDFLVEFAVLNGIPTKEPLQELADDVQAYVYHCAMNKVCCVCRKHAGIHHVDAVGMGRNRDEINHLGMQALPLCWGVNGHHQEAHRIGNNAFLSKYHLETITIDEKIVKLYKLGSKEQEL